MNPLQRLRQRFDRWLPVAPLRRWLAAVILLATVPLAFLMSLQIILGVRADQAQIENALARSAATLAQSVESELAASFELLSMLARAEAVRRGDASALSLLWRDRGDRRRDWHSVFLLDADGSTLLDTGTELTGNASAELAALRLEVTRARAPTAALLPSALAGQAPVALALPVTDGEGPPRVLGVRIGPGVWERLVSAYPTPEGGQPALFDGRHRLVSPRLPGELAPTDLSQAASAAMEGRSSGVHRHSAADGRMVYAAWHEVPMTGWVARVAVPAGPIDAAHRSAMLTALAASGGSLVLGLALAWLLARRTTEPLRALATGGPPRVGGRQPVEEIGMLRDALHRAACEDEAARAQLEARAQEFETLFQNTPAPTAVALDAHCREVRYNAAMQALIDAVGPLPDLQIFHAGQPLPRAQWPLQRAALQGEPVLALELEIRNGERPPVSVLAHAVALRDAQGQPRGAISVLVDITQRKLAESQLLATDLALREHQGLMDLAQETGHVGFLYYRFAGDTLDWTPGQCRLFALEAAPAEDGLQGWFSRIDATDRLRVEREFWSACAQQRQRQTLEYGVARPGGAPRWLSSRIVLRYDSQGRAEQMLAVTVDMTEQKDAEREQTVLTEREIALRQQAEAASRAKDEFLTMLSHELRNPLGAISAAVDVLDTAPLESPTAGEARSIIARQTRNLAHMMTDLLDVGRAIAGKIVLTGQAVNLAVVATRVMQALSLTGEAARHDVRLRLQEAWVQGDAVRLDQVLTNLVTNALRYTPDGGRIDLIVSRTADSGIVQVKDTGPGIPPTLMPRIFDLFVQGERTLDRRAGGLGIGLTLVRRLVELHHGTVTVESSEKGSCFTVALPATAAPLIGAGNHLPVPRRRSVLLIEDNEDVRSALRFKLELDGHLVDTAADGVDGLARLLELRPEVSIVDIGLPGLTGLELARHARAAGYGGRMIALSGYGHERDVKKAMVAGFDAYLVKPVERQDLHACLRQD